MDKKLKFEKLPDKFRKLLSEFIRSYRAATSANNQIVEVYCEKILEFFENPFHFEPYHKKSRFPFDYYRFGLEFIRPVIDFEHSTVQGLDIVNGIEGQLKRRENAILLANHQTEIDPQVIALLLEEGHPQMAEQMIFVAGERVITDPLAIPLSMGCDLLCIYSKRYIDEPPEQKGEKQLHNKRTMELMSQLLQEGGKIIYIAPSGGRDRKTGNGEVEIAPFDPSSIELVHLMSRKAKRPTHFYPLTLATYDLLPPPDTIQKELGEMRRIQKGAITIAFSPEFDMDHFPGSEEKEKTTRRKNRADAIWNIVNNTYQGLK